MKKLKKLVLCLFVIFTFYLCNSLSGFFVISLNGKDISAFSNNKKFLLGGDSIGIKLLADGVLVMKSDRDDDIIKVGDIILEVDSQSINTSKKLEEFVEKSEGNEMKLKIKRGGEENIVSVNPNYDSFSDSYKLNIWVKDSSAGVGTVTFYEKQNMTFASLGHGVTETDENYILPIETGAITFTDIYNIKKGYANEPGEVRGTITNKVIGTIITNTDKGIYGKIVDRDFLNDKAEIMITSKNKIKTGKAKIYTSVNYGEKEYYDIEIQKIMLNSTSNKNMIIKVTDKKLLSLTGGIIQGMSGSPIIQDGKLIGAVTHVLLNDPTTGYGVFIENMLDDIERIDIY